MTGAICPCFGCPPEDADIHDPAVWKRYNPGPGYSLDLAEMAEE
jgi:hypothetical protein